ncbi:glycosyltransferase [Paenibacillus sp. FA6]|uniref:glycosyltransferase n=1 Tax=Paenibacillus sp. FA6 TaxID=3413029 RepID=UPI003F65714A
MKRLCLKGLSFCLVLVMASMPLYAGVTGDVHARTQKECLSPSKVQLKSDLRKLWTDHMIWTRNYIVSALAGLEDQEKVSARLLKNQRDIGNAFKPYYGQEAGNKFTELLREHILIAGKIVDAAKSGNQIEFETNHTEWYRNTDDIARFLSGMNPKWSDKELKGLLYKHLQLITDEVTARIKKDWDADIMAYDIGETHMVMFADILADGIIKQFPKQLK